MTVLLILLALAVSAQAEEEPIFPARGENGLWGYINAEAEWAIAPQFSRTFGFSGSYAIVCMAPEGLDDVAFNEYIVNRDCWGVIDRAGRWVLPPEYTIQTGVREGIWPVTKRESEDQPEGFFDSDSGCFSGLRWARVDYLNSADSRLIPVYDPDTYLYGYADRTTGETVIACQFGGVEVPASFHEGVAAVRYEDPVDGNASAWPFLIDERGDVIPLPEGIHAADSARASEGLIAVTDEQGRYGFADLVGHVVIAPQFYSEGTFSEGLACVRLAEGDWGYIDRRGEIVLRGYGVPLGDFRDGHAQVTLDGQQVYIDRTGKVSPGAYMSNGLAWVREAGSLDGFMERYHLIDRMGHQVGPSWYVPFYESRAFDEGRQPVCDKNGCFCFLDDSGAVVIEGPFTDAGSFDHGLALVCDGEREGYIDRDGNAVYFWAYQEIN